MQPPGLTTRNRSDLSDPPLGNRDAGLLLAQPQRLLISALQPQKLVNFYCAARNVPIIFSYRVYLLLQWGHRVNCPIPPKSDHTRAHEDIRATGSAQTRRA